MAAEIVIYNPNTVVLTGGQEVFGWGKQTLTVANGYRQEEETKLLNTVYLDFGPTIGVAYIYTRSKDSYVDLAHEDNWYPGIPENALKITWPDASQQMEYQISKFAMVCLDSTGTVLAVINHLAGDPVQTSTRHN
jgi:hypothetical protein